MSTQTPSMKTLATNVTAGPIIQNISISTLQAMMGDTQARYALVNAELAKIMDAQAEGTRLELVLTALRDPTGTSQASAFAQALQTQYEYGQLKDPATGDPVLAWPEYPGQIAWADDNTATLVIRWVKGQIELAPILWAVLVGVIIGIVIIEMLHAAPYTASAATNAAGVIGIGPSGPTVFGVPVWPNAVLGAVAIALVPASIGWYSRTQHSRAAAIRAQRELDAAERGDG